MELGQRDVPGLDEETDVEMMIAAREEYRGLGDSTVEHRPNDDAVVVTVAGEDGADWVGRLYDFAAVFVVEEHLTGDEERPDSYEMRIERLEDEVNEYQAEIARLRENTVSEETFKDFVEIVENEVF